MIVFVECWKARQAWLDLDKEARAAYMNALGNGIGELIKAGVEIVTWSRNDPATSQAAPFDYFAIWKFPSPELATGFEKVVEQSGWYQYFEQVNLKGELSTPDQCIGHMIGL
jgi:hypothetical protein